MTLKTIYNSRLVDWEKLDNLGANTIQDISALQAQDIVLQNNIDQKADKTYVDSQDAILQWNINLKADQATTYTKTEVNNIASWKVDKTTKVNWKALSSDVTLTTDDVAQWATNLYDKVVSLLSWVWIQVTWTYPNFTITNSSPDQLVSLTQWTGISISGTYPNFTITNSSPDQTVSLTAGTNVTITWTYPNFTINATWWGWTQNLQQVTDLWATTTNSITVDWLQLDTTPSVWTAAEWQFKFNATEWTFDFWMPWWVTYQWGLENFKTVKADWTTLTNGKLVMFSWSDWNSWDIKAVPFINNWTNPAYLMVGIMTETVTNGNTWKATWDWKVRWIQTNWANYWETWVDWDLLYPNPNYTTYPWWLTNVIPTAPKIKTPIAAVVNAHWSNWTLLVRAIPNHTIWEQNDVDLSKSKTTPVDADVVLLQDSSDSSVWKKLTWANIKATLKTYFDWFYSTITTVLGKKEYHWIVQTWILAPLPTNTTTTTFTITTGTTPLTYWRNGVSTTVNTNKSVTHSSWAWLKFIYFTDDAGTLTSYDSFQWLDWDKVILATVYWNGTDYWIVNDERHWHTRDIAWHKWAHETIWSRYNSWLNFSFAWNVTSNTTFSISSWEIDDEDIHFPIATQTQCRLWQQTWASTYAFNKTLSTTPYSFNVTWPTAVRSDTYATVAISASNRYFNYFVYGTTSCLAPIHVFTETVSPANVWGYTSVANARAVAPPSLIGLGLSAEWKLLYRLVVNGAWLIQTLTAADDYRTTSTVAWGGTITSINASAVTESNYWNVQTAVDTLVNNVWMIWTKYVSEININNWYVPYYNSSSWFVEYKDATSWLVPTSRTLTINWTWYDLSADRSWTITPWTFWQSMLWAPTRASNTTFTVTWDATSFIAKWMIIKWTESSAIKCAMVSIPSTYSNPNTTVTIIWDTMSSIDANSLKYCYESPELAKFSIAWSIWATWTDVANAYYATRPMRVIGADLQVGTAWTTNSTTIDINKGWTTMFTTKPTLASTVAASPTPFTADSWTSLALADKVTIDIDAVQTTRAVDLYATLYLFPTYKLNLS